MRIVTIGLVLILSTTTVFSNDFAFKYCNLNQVKRVFQIGNTVAHLSLSESGPEADYYVIWGANMFEKTQKKEVFPISRQFHLKTVLTSGNTAIVVFENSADQTLAFFQIDEKVRIIKQRTLKSQNLGTFRTAGIDNITVGENGEIFLSRSYYIYASEKARKVVESGAEVRAYSKSFEPLWQYNIKTTEDCVPAVEEITPQKEGCVLSVSNTCNKGKEMHIALHTLSKLGQQTGLVSLKKEEGTLYPTLIKNVDNEMLVAGMYFDGPFRKSKNSDGMFLAKMSLDGKLANKTLTPWTEIIEQIEDGTKNDFLLSGDMQVLIQDIWATDAGYQVIGESFVKSSGVTGGDLLLGNDDKKGVRALTVFDFILFDYKKDGSFSGLQKMAKEKRNILIRGREAYSQSVQLSKIIRENELFSYRSFNQGAITYFNLIEGAPHLITANFASGEEADKTALVFGPDVEEESSPEYESKFLQKLSDFQDSYDDVTDQLMATAETVNYGIARTDQVFTPNALSISGLLVLENSAHYSYIMDPTLKTVYVRRLN